MVDFVLRTHTLYTHFHSLSLPNTTAQPHSDYLTHSSKRTHTIPSYLDLAYDFEPILSLEEHIEGHVPVPVLHLMVGEEELVLYSAHCQACLSLCVHEPLHRLQLGFNSGQGLVVWGLGFTVWSVLHP